jgi:hypothetical protein
MDAAADYAAAKAMLSRPLPAYISYTAHAHVKFDAITHDDTRQIVVRTSDGKVLKGSVPSGVPSNMHIGNDNDSFEPAVHPAFKPACYSAKSASLQNYQGRSLEAIGLTESCNKDPDDKDFDTLYVDPRTHEPVAVTGSDDSQHVYVNLSQQYTRVGDNVLPSTFFVRVKGSGMMFWLDVLVDMSFSDYRFSNTEP